MKKTLTLLALILFFAPQIFSQNIYSRVAVKITSPQMVQALTAQGFDTDHLHFHGDEVELTLSAPEVERLGSLGYGHEILIEDLTAHFLKQQEETAHLRNNMDCGLDHFDEGSMGGYHTYSDAEAHLSDMAAEYPDIVLLETIGTSIEGREIWGVKISDNVNEDESDTEGVAYFDALHHAREPMSLEATLYYMWWLLENYGTDDQATYLVNHRELYFIPVVNPDGYVYNQTTNPLGGGFWRKNRRDDGSGCFGVDLNRQYSYQWGLEPGSSNDPCSEIYRGEAPFSEPEAAAVRDYVHSFDPAIAFTNHTYGQTFLNPLGYTDTVVLYEKYSELASEFTPRHFRGYGTTSQMLGYSTSGTTRDWFFGENIIGWTSEIGYDFWEPSANICERVQEFMPTMQYLSMVAGQYTVLQNHRLENEDGIWTGDDVSLSIRLKNRGLSQEAENVVANLRSLHPALTPEEVPVTFGSLEVGEIKGSGALALFELTGPVEVLERLPIEVTITQDGDFSSRDTFYLTAGHTHVIFEADGETADEWLSWGEGILWDTTFIDRRSGFHSFADTRYGNYLPETETAFEPLNTFDLSATENPQLEFWAKWSLQPHADFVQLQRVDGVGWEPLSGDFTEITFIGPAYTQTYHWVQEQIDLSDWTDEQFIFRFLLTSNQFVQGDGFYFDDLRIVDYFEPTSSTHDLRRSGLALSVFPNPSDGRFKLRIFSKKTGEATLTVRNALGKMVASHSAMLFQGDNRHPFQLPDCPVGIYFLEIKMDGGMVTEKVVVN